MITRIQIRRGTSAAWAAANPVLAAGELGAAIDGDDVTSVRIGNGVDHWADLPSRAGVVHSSPDPPTPSDGAVGDWWIVTEGD